MLQLTPGDQHHRVLVVGALVGRDDVGRHEARAPAFTRKTVDEHHRLARVALGQTGVGDGVLSLQPVPGHAADAGHAAAHFIEHLGDMAVGPAQPQALGQLLNDPQVLARVAGRVDGLAAHLHQPVGVGETAGFLGKGARRQDHVGQVGGLGQEDVLHHQVVERGQRLAGVVGVGVGHRRVLAHHVHAAHTAGLDGVHHLHHRQAGLSVQRARCQAPGRLEARTGGGVRDMLVVGQHHRDQAGVGRALHVVLATQGVQAGAGPPDLAGHQRQRDQTARVVSAVHMLRHAHAPQDHRGLGRGVQPRHFAQHAGFNAANRGHRLGAVGRHVGAQGFVADGAAGDEIGID